VSFTAAEKIFELLDEPVTIREAARPVTLARVAGEVEFRDVAFSYGREPVLEDVSSHADPGDMLAFTTLRASVVPVLQDNFLFSGAIADNIRYARPGASEEDVLGCPRFVPPTRCWCWTPATSSSARPTPTCCAAAGTTTGSTSNNSPSSSRLTA